MFELHFKFIYEMTARWGKWAFGKLKLEPTPIEQTFRIEKLNKCFKY